MFVKVSFQGVNSTLEDFKFPPLCATNVPMFEKSFVDNLECVLYHCYSNRLRIAEHRQQDQEYVYPC